ncbi:MAG: InlB B-repeat-containing protein [Kiritimatiellae bacterium]|nr:InlB B-repeat-containing protein [Kiritimatiellia bacterium]
MKKSTVKSIAFVAAVCLCVMPFLSFAEVKALSFAINEAHGTGDKTPIKTFMATNDVDFGAFEYARADSYFINAEFTLDDKHFKVAHYMNAGYDYKYFIYNSDKYELVDEPSTNKSSHNMAAAFRDEYGDTNVLVSLRGSYTASSVKSYLDGIANRYPGGRIIVTYNQLVGDSNSETLNDSLMDSSSGPGMTCLGRTDVNGTAIGGVYMYPTDVPSSYSVTLVPKSIGTKYNGTLATLGFPTKCTVIFNDWDGTGLQTNIVFAGQSVTPPTVPGRDGYTFTGWDHPASDFESVPASFTATAQYAENAAWLLVSGEPDNLGTADPAYGTLSSIAASDAFTASVAAPAVEEDATERWVCTGYTHYEITDVATGAKTVAQEGNTASFAYTHVFQDELVWHFTNEWLVTASATAGGSVSATETWVRNGESLQLGATPDEGWEFLGWRGDTDGIADVTSASIEVSVTSARSLRAIFAPHGADASVQYVATTGDNANSGYFSEAPKLTIQAAVDVLAGTVGYGTVYVGAGTYVLQNSVVITNAITVLGATGNPENVILHAKDVKSTEDMLALRVNHADALVANLSVENGHGYQKTSYPYGSNIAIEGNGGTVSNCVIRGGTWYGMYARGVGAWLNSDAALLTHCVVTNNNTSGSSKQISGGNIYGGLFVHIEKGVVANCLIANNRDTGGTNVVTDERQSWACGVTVRNGCILNCTVVTNEARYTGGIYLYPEGYATNVVVAGCVNRCTYYEGEKPKFTDIGFKGTIANASHCASDGGEALDEETCVAGTAAKFFRSMADCDYRPALDSPLINAGIAYEGIASFDLLGKKRVQGRAPDIGCFESAPSGLSVVLR